MKDCSTCEHSTIRNPNLGGARFESTACAKCTRAHQKNKDLFEHQFHVIHLEDWKWQKIPSSRANLIR